MSTRVHLCQANVRHTPNAGNQCRNTALPEYDYTYCGYHKNNFKPGEFDRSLTAAILNSSHNTTDPFTQWMDNQIALFELNARDYNLDKSRRGYFLARIDLQKRHNDWITSHQTNLKRLLTLTHKTKMADYLSQLRVEGVFTNI